jgi:hypothetical protein
VRVRELNALRAAGVRGSEGFWRDGNFELPIGELQFVAEMFRIVEEDRVQQSRQFVLRSNPHLHEHTVVDVCHNVRRCSADHMGLTDVISELQPLCYVLIRISNHQVCEGKVDPRGVVSLLQRRVNGARCIGDGHQVFRRCIGHHYFAVIVEFGRGTIA